jgi:hypothetical protein
MAVLEWKDAGERLLFFQGRKVLSSRPGYIYRPDFWLVSSFAGCMLERLLVFSYTQIGFNVKGMEGRCLPSVTSVPFSVVTSSFVSEIIMYDLILLFPLKLLCVSEDENCLFSEWQSQAVARQSRKIMH